MVRVNNCDKLYTYNYNKQYRSYNRTYYQNYSSDYNRTNKDQVNTYNNQRNAYKRLMKQPGCIIEHIEKPIQIYWS